MITVTLENSVADTLDRHMVNVNTGLPPGVRISKSNYVSESVKSALVRDGLTIVMDDKPAQPAKEPLNKFEPL